ncbi:MAG: hypothetical protein JST04_11175 [Bdellovibrionales bacterium]|nr:hypothetical protein [Bdellovibrionales bacterium]
MQKFYLYFGTLLIFLAAVASSRGYSLWSSVTTGRFSPTGPRAYHK